MVCLCDCLADRHRSDGGSGVHLQGGAVRVERIDRLLGGHRHLRHLDLVSDRATEESQRTAAVRRGAAAMTDTEQTGTAVGAEARAMQSGHAAHLPGDGAMWVMVLGDLVFF